MGDPVPDPLRSCITKKRYDYEDQAERVAASRLRASGIRLRVYMCTECGGFHLTKRNVEYVEPKPGWRVAKIGEREMARRRHIEQRHGRRRR